MLLNSKEDECVFEVLDILNRGKSKYSIMFRKTGVSHTTLQRVLVYLVTNNFIRKDDIGHMKVDYEITKKGKELLELLKKLRLLL